MRTEGPRNNYKARSVIQTASGVERFVEDMQEVNLDEYYLPYPMQANFHASAAKHRLLGGAAGPGKTLAMIIDHLIAANEFSDPKEAAQVHTLLLRRTHPKLEATLITRFREKIPQELYKDFNETKKVVTWLNGATTHFGSMQYEHDVWGWQGQWYKIGYDELTEFTFKQWSGISAWNRCPVSPYATKDGATNPIGVGAGWVKSLFVDKQPSDEMDKGQRAQYSPDDYAYFPCTYVDNPVYATDQNYISNLKSYQSAISNALMYGEWGVAGGYFQGAWDPALNVFEADKFEVKPWYPKWISGDWGFEHWAAIYWHCMDEHGIVRTYREFVTDHETPEQLAESIASRCLDYAGKPEENLKGFPFSHDAFAQRTDPSTIASRMARVMAKHGLPQPLNAGKDLVGRGQIMYELLNQRVKVGEIYNDERGCTEPMLHAKWQISDSCHKLIEKIPLTPRDEDEVEKMAEFPHDDPIHGAGHGIYWKFGRLAKKPTDVLLAETLEKIPDMQQKSMAHRFFDKNHKDSKKPFFIKRRRVN